MIEVKAINKFLLYKISKNNFRKAMGLYDNCFKEQFQKANFDKF